jgi:hypothetical protein
MMDEEAIRSVIERLSRPHPSGGQVIERAAVVAEGIDSGSILAWIASHDGQPEAVAASGPKHGLHHGRLERETGTASTIPRRYVLPPGALA